MQDLHVVVEGELGSATPTVLIHGVGSDLLRWDPVVAPLREVGPVVRYDLRGHGQSPKPPGPYQLADFVDDHRRLMASLGINRANVVGLSLGGLIAQSIALTDPASVAHLVILSAVAGRTPRQQEAVLKRLRVVEEGGPAAVADGGERWYTEKFRTAHPEVVDAHLARFGANDPAAYAAAFRVLATNDLVDDLHRIDAPTLIMTGALDVGSPPEMAREMHRRIQGSRLVIVDDIKHSILEEAHAEVAAAIREFLVGETAVRSAQER
ncbi:alpha/beta fold hydrolase [Amycolatopsis sp. NPDC047767]|uniref:alpha/beta fold hydrolase n=1 Tax=Amycolatopsis sp. NPDC047767 TaxID=3156765 RepID=UPI00345456FE